MYDNVYIYINNINKPMSKKITSKDARVSVRVSPNQDQMLKTISKDMNIKRSTLVRYAIDQIINNYNDLQLEQV